MQLDWYFLNPNTAGVFYQYDPNGNLLWQQTVGGGSTGFLEHEAATHYYWLPNEHGDILIGFDQGANSYAVYTDHLNTPRLVTKIEIPQNPRDITDTANDLPEIYGYGQPQGISPLAIPVWQWSYSPFGADLANGYEAKPTTLANNFKPDLWIWTGLPETGGADPYQVAQETWRIQANLSTPPTLNIRYPGQYYDFEAGLVQNWWRTYEPRIGRYSSADPIGLEGGWNRFAYVEGDGVNNADPMGLIKIHGNWCGPNWTGGKKEPYKMGMPKGYYKVPSPGDVVDSGCMVHDIDYAVCRKAFPCDKSQRATRMTQADRNLANYIRFESGTTPALIYAWMNNNNLPDPGDDDASCTCKK